MNTQSCQWNAVTRTDPDPFPVPYQKKREREWRLCAADTPLGPVAETSLDPRGRMPGVRGAGIGQFHHLLRIALVLRQFFLAVIWRGKFQLYRDRNRRTSRQSCLVFPNHGSKFNPKSFGFANRRSFGIAHTPGSSSTGPPSSSAASFRELICPIKSSIRRFVCVF